MSADSQPPPSSADSAWFLTQNSGFAGHDGRRTTTDETGLPPLNPPGSSNRKPQRNSDFDFRFFAVSNRSRWMKSRGDRLEHRAVVDERGHQGALLLCYNNRPHLVASGSIILVATLLPLSHTAGSACYGQKKLASGFHSPPGTPKESRAPPFSRKKEGEYGGEKCSQPEHRTELRNLLQGKSRMQQ